MSIDHFNSISATGYADGSSLIRVVDHYDSFFQLGLTEAEKRDLIPDLLRPSTPDSEAVTSRAETGESFDPRAEEQNAPPGD